MKAFNKIFVAVIAMIILIFAVFNLLFASSDNTDSGRPYRVEINRLVFEIEQSGFDSVDMSGCEYVTHIEKYRDKFYDSDSDYTIREINGVLYRFDYTTDMESDKSSVMLMVNIILGILSAMIIGVLIFIRIKILLPFENLTNVLEISAKKGTEPFIIICDEIEDPHNLGAIIRTAEAAGADGIIIPKRRSASLNATVHKTSAGAASWVPVARVSNLAGAIDKLKENGVWIYGTDASGEDYDGVDLKGSIALVIGSEGFGMGRLIKEKCDFLLKLPMNGKITSLNASVAAGIFMYEAVRQRTKK